MVHKFYAYTPDWWLIFFGSISPIRKGFVCKPSHTEVIHHIENHVLIDNKETGFSSISIQKLARGKRLKNDNRKIFW